MNEIPPDLQRLATANGFLVDIDEGGGWIRTTLRARTGKSAVRHGATATRNRNHDRALALALDLLRTHLSEAIAERHGTYRSSAAIEAAS